MHETHFKNSEPEDVPAEAMITLLYEELRRLAAARMSRERRDHTFTPTVLVHEAYMRLAKEHHGWKSRAHFFSAAAEAMRRTLIDHARAANTTIRGGDVRRESDGVIDGIAITLDGDQVDLIALDAAMQKLREVDQSHYQVVMLRFFAGLTTEEIAEQLSLSSRHVKRLWQAARVWLLQQIDEEGEQAKQQGP